ncbi:DUF4998 domain-containing protein [Fulvivirgaceae bacterium BMA10]|uniref:DUF4998 domain-containing protein n=1 Tax=Splendidivirga corallicola TaxID=3051826 RepID=A0ABT8KNG0_9BACT|nr:DUF4998 domain-containing protein [Fulvivirgaceae bacterium BMA10]
MKNSFINYLTCFSIISVLVFSCKSQDDTFSEFVNQGENVIVGSVQDVIISHGVKKLKLNVAINGDPKIKKVVISDGTETVGTFDVTREKSGNDTLNYVLELEEKLYNFVIKTTDGNENESLPFEFTTTVYGDKYISNLSTRKIASVAFNNAEQTAVVTWDDPFERMKDTRLTYQNRSDTEVTLVVSNDENETIISDFSGGTNFNVVSSYLPPLQDGETAFEDFLSLEVNEVGFPTCETVAEVTTSLSSLDFGQLNKDQNSTAQSFVVQSDDCISGSLTLSAAEPFQVSTMMDGPFETSISLESLASPQTVYVRFSPVSGKNQVYNGQINLTAANLTNPPVVDLTGEEIGNDKSGLNILGPDESGDFATITLPNDAAPRLDWGGPYHEALFDGNTGTHGHGDSGSNPGHFTIDLGKDYVITKVGWKHRSGFQSRGLKRYQVWGLPSSMDVNAAATATVLSAADPGTESTWSKEMSTNGWVSLVNATLETNPPEADGQTHDVSGFVYVRYIRVAVFESFDGDFFNFGELELTADFDQ